ncbi:MAG TPA: exosortase/archaeosortase family protein, partial [Daejeonella sp.]|nr:exosortase/archaeosortase family protein [Daejeonella sp.]
GITAPGNYYSQFLDEHLNYISGFRNLLIGISAWIIRIFGYQVFTSDTTLHALNAGGINVVYSCLGFGVMSFFVAFVIAWPQRSLNSKLWFIPAGLFLIQALNIARFIMITLFWRNSPYRSVIDHHTLFNVILYAILLASIYFWINANNSKRIVAKTL